MQSLRSDERQIISAILQASAARGLLVSVWDGEDWAVKVSASSADIAAAIGATCETTLLLRDPARPADGASGAVVGRVLLVHGNGCDVISDYSDNADMAAILAPALLVSERVSL